MISTSLESRFRTLGAAVGARREIEAVFQQIESAYAEPQRVFHGMKRIEGGLALLDEVRSTVASPDCVELAWWFHDVVFQPRPLAQNEERSAEHAYAACLRMGIGEATAQRIARMVRATKTHEAEDADTAVLVDLELAILGSDPLTYATFERDIRAEYGWLPLDDRSLRVDVDDPRARGVVERLRAIPGYRHEEEAQATTFSPSIVYSRGRWGLVEGPLRMPEAAAQARGPYRT